MQSPFYFKYLFKCHAHRHSKKHSNDKYHLRCRRKSRFSDWMQLFRFSLICIYKHYFLAVCIPQKGENVTVKVFKRWFEKRRSISKISLQRPNHNAITNICIFNCYTLNKINVLSGIMSNGLKQKVILINLSFKSSICYFNETFALHSLVKAILLGNKEINWIRRSVFWLIAHVCSKHAMHIHTLWHLKQINKRLNVALKAKKDTFTKEIFWLEISTMNHMAWKLLVKCVNFKFRHIKFNPNCNAQFIYEWTFFAVLLFRAILSFSCLFLSSMENYMFCGSDFVFLFPCIFHIKCFHLTVSATAIESRCE